MAVRKGKNERLKGNSYKYYNMGSAAPSIDPLEYPNYEPKVFPKRRPKPKIDKDKQKRKEQNREQIKQRALYNVKFLFTSVVVLLCCILIIAFNSIIAETNKGIKELTVNLNELKEKNSTLQAEISGQIDLKSIEKIATEKLLMSKPAKHQIVYIDVPKSNYTVQNDMKSLSKESNIIGIIETVKNFITKIFNE